MRTMFESASRRQLGSRIHGPRHVLSELRRLRAKIEKAYLVRAGTPGETTWCLSAADKLDAVIVAGEAILPGIGDPRPSRRARKRLT